MSPEFDLIAEFFTKPSHHTDLSIGDDAALIQVQPMHQLNISTDMLVAGTHFFENTNPRALGWKALAVNLSDMAAMGANPKWATLSLALPEVNQTWLAQFSQGLFDCAKAFNIDLIGGDTTKGPLTINLTIMGETPNHQALTRSNAQAGDDIWVSGQLGNAAMGLQHLQGTTKLAEDYLPVALDALHQPQPRCQLGIALRGIATSCIDLSDGLLADLTHILSASNLGARLHLDAIPVHKALADLMLSPDIQQCVLAGGEDYELCFTAPRENRDRLNRLSQDLNLALTCIGTTLHKSGLTVLYDNKPLALTTKGYDHFA